MGKRKIIAEPPPVHTTGDLSILVEVEPEVAIALWQLVRHTRDWHESSPTQRAVLFKQESVLWVREKREHASAGAPEIDADLRILQELIRKPLLVGEKQIANACEHIARWAESRGARNTAVRFAELAAGLDRADPRLANLAGRLARNAGDYERADTWLERGIGLARGNRDWIEYTRGHLGAGIMCMQRGLAARAKRHLHTASTIAMREGHEWLAAEAQHDLFHFMTVRGLYADAEMHARHALAWYPKHHPRLPFFAADVAFLLICERRYTAAVRILKRFVRLVKPPDNPPGHRPQTH
jgi:tetratricopeptide (TPR) repeat protein